MFGLLNIDKPARCTSRDIVNVVQRLARPAKVGHAGTLDPLATGVLVVALGPATRLVEYIQQMPKAYRGTFLLGYTSPTEDIDGEVRPVHGAPQPSLDQLRQAAMRFVGETLQQPPAYSALKVRGRRAYELARRGDAVELEPRKIKVYSLEVVDYHYPELVLQVECGSGTYLRSLGRDLARAVGTEAVMRDLVREAIGPFLRSNALDAAGLDRDKIESSLLPAQWALKPRRQVSVTPDQAARLAQGQPITYDGDLPAEDREIVAVDNRGRLIALLCRRAANSLWPVKNFTTS